VRKNGFSFYIQRIGLQAALVPGLGQTHCVQDSGGDSIAIRGMENLRLAGVGRSMSRACGEAR
jgi:hypothetical protein